MQESVFRSVFRFFLQFLWYILYWWLCITHIYLWGGMSFNDTRLATVWQPE